VIHDYSVSVAGLPRDVGNKLANGGEIYPSNIQCRDGELDGNVYLDNAKAYK
jgi:hypothetical protein